MSEHMHNAVTQVETAGSTDEIRPEQFGWAANAGDDWQRVIDNRIGLRVVRYRAVYFVYASDGIPPKQPTAVFSQSGYKTLPEALRVAEVLGEALRTALDQLARIIRSTPR